MTDAKQPEITLPKVALHRQPFDGCVDYPDGYYHYTSGHGSEQWAMPRRSWSETLFNANGYFITQAQTQAILADPSKALEIFTGAKK